MTDDYRDRIRESNDFLDHMYDQQGFEDDLAARSARLHAALRHHDDGRARWELGIPPPDPSDAADGPRQVDVDESIRTEPSQTPSAQEQFEDHQRKLLSILKVAQCLPADVTAAWAAAVRAIDSVEGGLRTIAALEGERTRLDREHTLRRGYSPDPDFDREIWQVARELAWLEHLLRYYTR